MLQQKGNVVWERVKQEDDLRVQKGVEMCRILERLWRLENTKQNLKIIAVFQLLKEGGPMKAVLIKTQQLHFESAEICVVRQEGQNYLIDMRSNQSLYQYSITVSCEGRAQPIASFVLQCHWPYSFSSKHAALLCLCGHVE